MIKVNLNILTEHFYICSQLMKYQNMRGGRVKLHQIMVRNLLFFSAKKRETFWCLNYLINHHCKWLLKENALISNQFLLTNDLRKCRNFSLENFHLDILAQRLEAAQWKTLLSLWLLFTSSRKRAVQWRQRNVQKRVMHVQSCCFSNLRPCWHGVGDPGLVG